MLLDERSGFLGNGILILLQIHSENLVKLFGSIVGEVDVAVETRLKTRVGIDELLHLVGIACHDNHQTVTVVLHALQQGGNSLLAIVGGSVALGKGIRLVDKEDTTQCGVAHLVDTGSGLSHILSDKSGTVCLYEMSFLEDS